jgi:hypothetical protein
MDKIHCTNAFKFGESWSQIASKNPKVIVLTTFSLDMDYLQRLLKQVTCPVLLYYGNKRRVWERTNGANGTWSPKNFKDSKNPVRSYELPPNVRISLVRLQGHAVQHSKVLLAFYEDLIDVMVLTREFGDGNHDDMTWHDSFPQKMQGVPIGTI